MTQRKRCSSDALTVWYFRLFVMMLPSFQQSWYKLPVKQKQQKAMEKVIYT